MRCLLAQRATPSCPQFHTSLVGPFRKTSIRNNINKIALLSCRISEIFTIQWESHKIWTSRLRCQLHTIRLTVCLGGRLNTRNAGLENGSVMGTQLKVTCFFLMSLRAAMSSGASDGTLVTTPVPEETRGGRHVKCTYANWRSGCISPGLRFTFRAIKCQLPKHFFFFLWAAATNWTLRR